MLAKFDTTAYFNPQSLFTPTTWGKFSFFGKKR